MGSFMRLVAELEEVGVPPNESELYAHAILALNSAGDDLSDAIFYWTGGGGTKAEAIKKAEEVIANLIRSLEVIRDEDEHK